MTKQENIEELISLLRLGSLTGLSPQTLEAIREATIAYEEQEPKTEWIPVSERLPEKPGDYLVTIKEKPFECPQRKFVCECHYCGNQLWNMPISFVVGEREVTAWQPLPKPYEPQESEA